MATKGQTHQKRAREVERRERRARKQAKKENRAAEATATADDGRGDVPVDSEPETVPESIQ